MILKCAREEPAACCVRALLDTSTSPRPGCCAAARPGGTRAPEAMAADTHAPLPLISGQQIVLPCSLEVTSTFVVREQGEWFEEELRFAVDNIVEEGWQVLDIGASYGLYTLALSARVGHRGQVTSFEPGPDSASSLRATLTLNSVSNVALVNTALLDEIGTARLQFHGSPELSALETCDHIGGADFPPKSPRLAGSLRCCTCVILLRSRHCEQGLQRGLSSAPQRWTTTRRRTG
jgi:hypothetical protein